MVAEIVVPGARRTRDLVRIADHEGDRHGLAERAAEAEHHAAEHADARERDDDAPHDLPRRAADAVGGLLQHRRHRFENVAATAVMNGSDHDGEDQARSEQADTVGRTGEKLRQHRHVSGRRDQPRLHVLLQEGCENNRPQMP